MKQQYDESKLPKWAQSELRVLRMRLAEAQAKLAEGLEDSTVLMDPYADPPRGLGTDPIIEFRLSGERHIQVHRAADGLLIRGSDGLVVQPRASNSIEVYERRLP